MDGNKDEAARCLKLAESALLSEDKQRALKFIRIAKRLDPAIRADELSASCRSPDVSIPHPQHARRCEHPTATSSGAAKPSGLDKGYTEDHVKSIREIRKSKDYYTILGVERSCSVEEIRKAYRKLSLKVHPDKNKAPGADEAFKIVSKAFKCLSEEESRRQYDQMATATDGYEFDPLHNNARRRRRTTTKTRTYDFFEEDLDPDEIFRSFFYGGTQGDVFRTQQVYRTRTARQQREQSVPGGGFNWMILLQFMLIVFFFVIASIPFSELHYSLQKTNAYQIPKLTEKHGVEYYVKLSDFDHKFPKGSSGRYKLEDSVERDYSSALGRYCHVEMQRRRWVRDYPTPHCDKLHSFRVA